MQSTHSSSQLPALPPLAFGDRSARVVRDFGALEEQFAHLIPESRYASRNPEAFVYKGSVIELDGVSINHAIYSHLVAVAPVTKTNVLIATRDAFDVVWRGSTLRAAGPQGFFIPRNDRLRMEGAVEGLAGCLILSFDESRLGNVLRAMSADQLQLRANGDVRTLPLVCGRVDFRRLFIALTSQIDGCGGDTALLRLAGFDDQLYRLLAMALRPDYFLSADTDARAQREARRARAIDVFERYVEDTLDQPISMSEIEARLGIGSRALQYACMKRHGCSPRTFIRNRKLERAYVRLRDATEPPPLARLAFELGFSSQSQFAKYFRLRFGVLPSEVFRPTQALRLVLSRQEGSLKR